MLSDTFDGGDDDGDGLVLIFVVFALNDALEESRIAIVFKLYWGKFWIDMTCGT